MSTKKTTERLSKSKAHRSAYVSSQISIGIPFQIRALRKQRQWDQKKLADEAGMVQPRISVMENAGYESFTLDVLKRLANAFDVALVVRFAPFSELMKWSDEFSPDTFSVPAFSDENAGAPNSSPDTQIDAMPGRLTPKQRVLRKWPKAVCFKFSNENGEFVVAVGQGVIASGIGAHAAWADAARRLKEKR